MRARLAMWLLVLTVVGYPVVGLMATLLNLESTLASIPFRALILGLALVVLVLSPQRSRWWLQQRWLLLFWALYLLRLLWDTTLAGIPGSGDALFIFVAICALPAIGCGLASGGQLPEKESAWRMGLLGAGVCTLAMAMQSFGWGSSQTVDPFITSGRLTFVAVNSITLGHTATTTLICVMCLSRQASGGSTKLVLAVMSLFAGLCLLAAGSRGPLVSLVACGLIFALGTGRRRLVFLMALLLAPAVLNPDTDLAQRIATSSGDDASSLERLVVQANALQQFVDNPVFGSAYAELASASYPHNIVIEAAMALGVPGLLLLLVLLGSSGMTAWRRLRMGQSLVCLLFVQYLVASQFSGSLWGIAPLWATLALLGAGSAWQRSHPRADSAGTGNLSGPGGPGRGPVAS